ncbi:hypothetical protein ABMA57_02285 [Saccharospirillum sp. HFRX-1]|uniref:hypothetical protein n=1 Tax=unclassified Saccharospirillum TaxID=2633430 RepID=UPI00371E1D17
MSRLLIDGSAIRKFLLIPTSNDWRSWSTPEKATMIGVWLTVFSIFSSIIIGGVKYIFSDTHNTKNMGEDEKLEVVDIKDQFYTLEEMRSRLPGFDGAFLALKADRQREIREIQHGTLITAPVKLNADVEGRLLSLDNTVLDLNIDGFPELYFYHPENCGSGGCNHDVYSYNVETLNLENIGVFNTSHFSVSESPINGWLPVTDYWRLGACEFLVTLFVFKDQSYKKETQHSVRQC